MRQLLKHIYKPFLFLTAFGIAMGFLESAVVFYIRKLYYPEGFGFPLKILPSDIIAVEWFREIATIIMLITVAWLAGKNLMQRFASFLYIFGVWDIFYYIWLKIMLDWPASLFDWDILFLIPVTWIGPVLAPIIISTTLIFFSALIIRLEVHHYNTRLTGREVSLLIVGALLQLYTFISDGLRLLLQSADYNTMRVLIAQYIPMKYNWPLFALGEIIIIYTIIRFYKRTVSHK